MSATRQIFIESLAVADRRGFADLYLMSRTH